MIKMNKHGVNVVVDGLTDCLEERRSGAIVDTYYKIVDRQLKPGDSRGWKFKWDKTQKDGYSVFELFVKGEPEVQGRVSCKIDGGVADLDIVESASHNIGQKGKYKGVGGHLFAIACKFSLDNGCDGFVAFTAKSDLIEHYQKELGAFLVIDRRMCIDDIAAGKLIEKYFKEENHHV